MKHSAIATLLFVWILEATFSFGATFVTFSQRQCVSEKAPCPLSSSSMKSASDDNISYVLQSMLKGSDFVYTYAVLRNIVNEHDNLIRDGEPAKEKKLFFFENEKPLVDFHRPELIVTQRGAQVKSPHRLLVYPITAVAILDFIRSNRHLLNDDEGDIELEIDSKDKKLKCESLLEEMSKFDGELLDYDDKFTSQEGLVYGIAVNRSKKRISVIFRGTVGIKDIFVDANFCHSTPDVLKDCKETIKVHSGFASYLFGEIPNQERTKFDRIVAALIEIYDELPKNDRDQYELFISGHSLGGALCNLFAFTAAETQDHKIFDKVTAVTFASPVVGDGAYNKAFQRLEKAGRLRHVRVSNNGDVITTQPWPRYTQNGVNLHLYENKKLALEYRNTKVLRPLMFLNVGKLLDFHSLSEYENRLMHPSNKGVLANTMEELYDEVTGDFTK